MLMINVNLSNINFNSRTYDMLISSNSQPCPLRLSHNVCQLELRTAPISYLNNAKVKVKPKKKQTACFSIHIPFLCIHQRSLTNTLTLSSSSNVPQKICGCCSHTNFYTITSQYEGVQQETKGKTNYIKICYHIVGDNSNTASI